jgi:hypothetical protein
LLPELAGVYERRSPDILSDWIEETASKTELSIAEFGIFRLGLIFSFIEKPRNSNTFRDW